ncbi:MAG: cobyric acid synthase [Burkholderiaceae bacterium]|nr:cobyric acid synthase [Burkholderiaceae bacterium]
MLKRAVLVWGATSGAGKSFVATALARLAARRGLRAAPFKAQNMSNNARVTAGGELATAQFWQALAAGVAPHPDHNPVLLKPEADTTSQVIVHGRLRRDLAALPWRARSPHLAQAARESFERLAAQHELLVIEGAGSPAEINLADCDFVNLEVARWAAARAPTSALLVVDIDRGGAFAHAYGTLALLPPQLRPLVRAVVLNRFRGDAALLAPGQQWLAEQTGVAHVAVLPMLPGHGLPEEDGPAFGGGSGPTVAVVCAPRASNLDEFSALAAAGVQLRWARAPGELHSADLVVLPGSKQTISDLAWLRAQGFDQALHAWAEAGRPLLGICGGLQMLGAELRDPQGFDGQPCARAEGLALLPLITEFAPDKRLLQQSYTFAPLPAPWLPWSGISFSGYEIRCGRTRALAPATVALRAADGEPVGWLAGSVLGIAAHGALEDAALTLSLLGVAVRPPAFDAMADALEAALPAALREELFGGIA